MYSPRSLPLTTSQCRSLHVTLPLISIACGHIEGVPLETDNKPHLLPKAPHRSFVTSLLIHPCLLLLCLLHELQRRLRCSRSHGSLHPWPGSKIVVNKISIAIIVNPASRTNKHSRMAREIMAAKIGRSSNNKRSHEGEREILEI